MASIPVPNGVKIEMVYQLLSTRMENVYWATKGTPATAADLLALWTIMRDWETNSARTQRGNQVTLQLISLTAMDGPGSPFYEAAPTPPITGTVAQTMLPAVTSVAIKHSTGLAGRSYRGRTYLIGMTIGMQQNADLLQPSTQASLVTIYTALRTTLLAGGWTFCVASLYSGVDSGGRAIPRAAGVLTPVISSSVELGLDTQRHRKAPYIV